MKGTSSICSTLNTPKYRKIDEPEILYVHEVNKTYIEYLRMCVDKAYIDADRWIKILQYVDSYDGSIQKEVFEKLVFCCKEMNDEGKIKIKNKIRYEIFRHRYFDDADWSRNLWLRISDKAEQSVFIWAVSECRKYGSFHTYLELLYDIKDKISIQELYKATLEISDLKGDVSSSMTDYYLKEIFDILQKAFIEDDEKCAELASLEWMCRNVLEWEHMKCMQKIMKDDPTFYALLVSIIYKVDDNETVDEAKRELANKVYSGFDKAKFCPTEKEGKVTYENLKTWMENFRELLIKQKQERLFGNLVGRLLAYSPIGEDGYSPCEAVRIIIEEYYTDSLKTYVKVKKSDWNKIMDAFSRTVLRNQLLVQRF